MLVQHIKKRRQNKLPPRFPFWLLSFSTQMFHRPKRPFFNLVLLHIPYILFFVKWFYTYSDISAFKSVFSASNNVTLDSSPLKSDNPPAVSTGGLCCEKEYGERPTAF